MKTINSVLNNYLSFLIILAIITFLSSHLNASSNVIKTANISINKQAKTVIIQSKLAIKKGILEYLLVGDYGKTYESIFKVSENKPSDLNFALLLIGCEPMDYRTFSDIKKKKNALEILIKNHKKSLLTISFLNNNKRFKFEELIKNRERQDHKTFWVYTGGFFLKDNRYAGDIELSFIGIWADQSAVINLCSQLNNPYQGKYGYELSIDKQNVNLKSDVEIIIEKYK